jgi:hypothetical protein
MTMTSPTADERIRERLEPMFRELEQVSMRRESDAAEADPERHKLTRVFTGPMRYRYWRSKDGRGTKVRYCYCTTPNAAGYYLVFRERQFKDGRVVRDQWRATERRIDAGRLATAMHEEASR